MHNHLPYLSGYLVRQIYIFEVVLEGKQLRLITEEIRYINFTRLIIFVAILAYNTLKINFNTKLRNFTVCIFIFFFVFLFIFVVINFGGVGVLGLTALCDSISNSISCLPETGRKKRDITDQRQIIQTTPTHTYYNHSRLQIYYHPN